MDTTMSRDYSTKSLMKSLDQVNSLMKTRDLSSPIGQANIIKASIIKRSKTKELSNLVSKRSKVHVRSVLAQWTNPTMLNSDNSTSDFSPSKAYQSRKPQLKISKEKLN